MAKVTMRTPGGATYYVRQDGSGATIKPPLGQGGIWKVVKATSPTEASKMAQEGRHYALYDSKKGTTTSSETGANLADRNTGVAETVKAVQKRGEGNNPLTDVKIATSNAENATAESKSKRQTAASQPRGQQGADPGMPDIRNNLLSGQTRSDEEIAQGSVNAAQNAPSITAGRFDPSSEQGSAGFEGFEDAWFGGNGMNVSQTGMKQLDPYSQQGQDLILWGILENMGANDSDAGAFLQPEMAGMADLVKILSPGGLTATNSGTTQASTLAGMGDMVDILLNRQGGNAQYVNPMAVLEMAMSQIQGDNLRLQTPMQQAEAMGYALDAISPYMDARSQQFLQQGMRNYQNKQMFETLRDPEREYDYVAGLRGTGLFG